MKNFLRFINMLFKLKKGMGHKLLYKSFHFLKYYLSSDWAVVPLPFLTHTNHLKKTQIFIFVSFSWFLSIPISTTSLWTLT